jgi:deoxyribonuclease V
MPLALHHEPRWDLSPAEAIRLQEQLRDQVRIWPLPQEAVRQVGGVDVGFDAERAYAAVVVLDYATLQPVERVIGTAAITFPYVPGLLSFREIPAILNALARLARLPDVFMVDGHGLAHPRRLGIAAHLGILLDLPAIGCAKSILIGRHKPLAEAVGSTAELLDGDEVIGAAVRTRIHARPLYVSIGHRVDLPSAIRLVLTCGRGYRLPEPTRLAHHFASHMKGTRL